MAKLFIANCTHVEEGVTVCAPKDLCILTDDYYFVGYRKYICYYNFSRSCYFFAYPKVRKYKPTELFKVLFY